MARRAPTQARIATPRKRARDTDRQNDLLDQVSGVLLADGFTSLTVDDLARRLKCSKTTLYGLAGNKSQLVVAVARNFFERATREIEEAIAEIDDPVEQVNNYLCGVGRAMSQLSPGFYRDMISYQPTADIYDINTTAAARRTRELIARGVETGRFRTINATFAGDLIALAIEGIHSGRLQEASGLTAGQAFVELGDLLVTGLRTR